MEGSAIIQKRYYDKQSVLNNIFKLLMLPCKTYEIFDEYS